MKILMISAGLPPRRTGGVPGYVVELMDGLSAAGQQVAYLDACGVSAWPFARLGRSRREGRTHYTLFNTGAPAAWHANAQPLREVRATRRLRSALRRLLARERPDIVHVQEMIGFSADLLPWLRALGCRVVLTSQDYYPLCPTLKLYRCDEQICTLPAGELICRRCCAGAPPVLAQRWDELLSRWGERPGRAWRRLTGLARRGLHRVGRTWGRVVSRSEDYQTRRRRFVAALAAPDVIVCMSRLHESIFRRELPGATNLRQLYLARRTQAAAPLPREPRTPAGAGPLVFLALNLVESTKGLNLLRVAFARLTRAGHPVELRVYGGAGRDGEGVIHRGNYTAGQLDAIVADADFGIVPSLWQEAYGYVGVEMLSRGLPLLVSSRGAMVEYVEHEGNGLHFDPSTVDILVHTIERLLAEPALRERLRAGAERTRFASFEEHVAEMIELYDGVLHRPPLAVPASV